MSQQSMNLRGSAQIVRRYKTLIGVAVTVGLIGGAGYGSLNPPRLTSEALVVLPINALAMPTEVVVAQSTPVLAGALPNVSPAMSVETLRSMVQASSQTANIIQISVAGATEAQAVGNANAVANSYVHYVSTPGSPVGRLSARILSPAQTATGTSPLVHRITFAIVGMLAGLVVGYIIALARARKSRGSRLRLRDEIANSIGLPVLASLPVSRPSSPVDWGKLLSTYEPGPVYAWRLRKALQQLALAGVHMTGGRDDGRGSSVAVVSLANDPGALALGTAAGGVRVIARHTDGADRRTASGAEPHRRAADGLRRIEAAARASAAADGGGGQARRGRIPGCAARRRGGGSGSG